MSQLVVTPVCRSFVPCRVALILVHPHFASPVTACVAAAPVTTASLSSSLLRPSSVPCHPCMTLRLVFSALVGVC